jgi:hypothetical protein
VVAVASPEVAEAVLEVAVSAVVVVAAMVALGVANE